MQYIQRASQREVPPKRRRHQQCPSHTQHGCSRGASVRPGRKIPRKGRHARTKSPRLLLRRLYSRLWPLSGPRARPLLPRCTTQRPPVRLGRAGLKESGSSQCWSAARRSAVRCGPLRRARSGLRRPRALPTRHPPPPPPGRGSPCSPRSPGVSAPPRRRRQRPQHAAAEQRHPGRTPPPATPRSSPLPPQRRPARRAPPAMPAVAGAAPTRGPASAQASPPCGRCGCRRRRGRVCAPRLRSLRSARRSHDEIDAH